VTAVKGEVSADGQAAGTLKEIADNYEYDALTHLLEDNEN
jgi:hypothetical protein